MNNQIMSEQAMRKASSNQINYGDMRRGTNMTWSNGQIQSMDQNNVSVADTSYMTPEQYTAFRNAELAKGNK